MNKILKMIFVFILCITILTQFSIGVELSDVLGKLNCKTEDDFLKKFQENSNIVKDLTDDELTTLQDALKYYCVVKSDEISRNPQGTPAHDGLVYQYLYAGQVQVDLGSFKHEEVKEPKEELLGYSVERIQDWLKFNSGLIKKLDPEVKEEWLEKTNNSKLQDESKEHFQDVINGDKDVSGYYQEQTDKAMKELKISDNDDGDSEHIYQLPGKVETGSAAGSLDDVIGDAEGFLSKGDSNKITANSLQDFSNTFYNILLTIGIIVAVIVGLVIGVRFMVGGAEDKANVKEILVPYIAGCVIVFGAFAIWKIAVIILQQL